MTLAGKWFSAQGSNVDCPAASLDGQSGKTGQSPDLSRIRASGIRRRLLTRRQRPGESATFRRTECRANRINCAWFPEGLFIWRLIRQPVSQTLCEVDGQPQGMDSASVNRTRADYNDRQGSPSGSTDLLPDDLSQVAGGLSRAVWSRLIAGASVVKRGEPGGEARGEAVGLLGSERCRQDDHLLHDHRSDPAGPGPDLPRRLQHHRACRCTAGRVSASATCRRKPPSFAVLPWKRTSGPVLEVIEPNRQKRREETLDELLAEFGI